MTAVGICCSQQLLWGAAHAIATSVQQCAQQGSSAVCAVTYTDSTADTRRAANSHCSQSGVRLQQCADAAYQTLSANCCIG
jgi:hypothetical protein